MPGVPSGKGCNACRKAKKKCDQQKPLCSRCKRLKISCTGAGTQRYVFKDQAALQRRKETPPVPANIEKALAALRTALYLRLDDTSHVVRSFIDVLAVDDVRYNILFAQGPILAELPKRIDTSHALKKTVLAYIMAYETHRGRCRPVDVIPHYVKALEAVRVGLGYYGTFSTPATPEFMCAMYLLMVVQAWIGSTRDLEVGHGKALIHLLETRCFQSWKMGSFEQILLMTLGLALGLESYCIPSLRIRSNLLTHIFPEFHTINVHGSSTQEWEDLLQGWTDAHFEVLSHYVRYLIMRLPEMMVDIGLQSEIPIAYVRSMAIVQKLDSRMHLVRANMTGPNAKNLALAAAYMYRFYGVFLAVALMINTLLSYSCMEFNPTDVAADQGFLISRTLTLSNDTLLFRPLGSSHVCIALGIALAVAEGEEEKRDLKEAIRVHHTLTTRAWIMIYAEKLKEAIGKYREMVEKSFEEAESEVSWNSKIMSDLCLESSNAVRLD